jgi:hypothetical protein
MLVNGKANARTTQEIGKGTVTRAARTGRIMRTMLVKTGRTLSRMSGMITTTGMVMVITIPALRLSPGLL